MKIQIVFLVIMMSFFPVRMMDAAASDQNHPVSSFTLKTVAKGERLAFVGVGGKIDGLVNPTLSVREWDVVKITLINDDGINHHITIPSFFITSKEVSEKGTKTVVTFVPFKTGGYGYYCILENHRALGMEGLVVVAETKKPKMRKFR